MHHPPHPGKRHVKHGEQATSQHWRGAAGWASCVHLPHAPPASGEPGKVAGPFFRPAMCACVARLRGWPELWHQLGTGEQSWGP